jgi:RES domain-containing protein
MDVQPLHRPGRPAGGRRGYFPSSIALPYLAVTCALSLAVLECFVHLDPADAPTDLVVIPADIPDDVSRRKIAAATLPRNWRAYPAPDQLADLGTAWARASATAVLVVPSAVVPQERNVLLNPAHPDFDRIQIGGPKAFSFDPRMWKR